MIDKVQGNKITSFSHIPPSEPYRVERIGVSENMVPRSMCEGRKGRKEGIGCWRKLRNEELRSLYVSPNIITVNTSRTMRWADRWKDRNDGKTS